jgi:hypothetical protein
MCIYAVREVVAFHRICPSDWRTVSVEYLHIYDFVKGQDAQRFWDQIPDAKVVDAVIGVMAEVFKYELDYDGNSVSTCEVEFEVEGGNEDGDGYERGKCGFFHFQNDLKQSAYEKEHTVVHAVKKCCAVTDRRLRAELGDCFGEWEGFENEKTIPAGLLS